MERGKGVVFVDGLYVYTQIKDEGAHDIILMGGVECPAYLIRTGLQARIVSICTHTHCFHPRNQHLGRVVNINIHNRFSGSDMLIIKLHIKHKSMLISLRESHAQQHHRRY